MEIQLGIDMEKLFNEIVSFVNSDLIFALSIVGLVFYAARKVKLPEKRKYAEVRKNEPKVVLGRSTRFHNKKL